MSADPKRGGFSRRASEIRTGTTQIPLTGSAPSVKKAATARRLDRLRVCIGCKRRGDDVFGPVASELPCDRCGRPRCFGFIVAASKRETQTTA